MIGIAATYDNSSDLRNYLYKGKKASLMGRGSPNRANYLSKALEPNSKLDCAQHSEIIDVLRNKVEEMRDELRIKDNLVSKLYEEENNSSRDPSPES